MVNYTQDYTVISNCVTVVEMNLITVVPAAEFVLITQSLHQITVAVLALHAYTQS